jgi:hypothetical protein
MTGSIDADDVLVVDEQVPQDVMDWLCHGSGPIHMPLAKWFGKDFHAKCHVLHHLELVPSVESLPTEDVRSAHARDVALRANEAPMMATYTRLILDRAKRRSFALKIGTAVLGIDDVIPEDEHRVLYQRQFRIDYRRVVCSYRGITGKVSECVKLAIARDNARLDINRNQFDPAEGLNHALVYVAMASDAISRASERVGLKGM